MNQFNENPKKFGAFRALIAGVIWALLAVVSVEIIFRRLAVGQIPTQFPVWLVYFLIALNAGYIFWGIQSFRQHRS